MELASGTARHDLIALAAHTTTLSGLAAYRLGDSSTAHERFLAAERLAEIAGDRTSEAMAMTARREVQLRPSS
jgi:hypothetical protein